MRLFFALALSEPTLDALALVVESLRARALQSDAPIAWESRSKMHITLKFLGEVAEDAVPSLVREALEVGRRHERFDVSLARLSAFPAEDVPRVLWIGVDAGSDHVAAIAEDIDASVATLGLERETRPFVPHVTIARAKRGAGQLAARRLLESPHPQMEVPTTHARGFVLMVSRAGTYETLHEIELGR